MYTPVEGDLPLMRYGRGYASESDWTPAVAQGWEERVTALRDQWAGSGVTVRLFKVGWQGRELGREAIVRVLQQVLEPIGGVQGNLGVYSELFDNSGVRTNGMRRCWGTVAAYTCLWS